MLSFYLDFTHRYRDSDTLFYIYIDLLDTVENFNDTFTPAFTKMFLSIRMNDTKYVRVRGHSYRLESSVSAVNKYLMLSLEGFHALSKYMYIFMANLNIKYWQSLTPLKIKNE